MKIGRQTSAPRRYPGTMAMILGLALPFLLGSCLEEVFSTATGRGETLALDNQTGRPLKEVYIVAPGQPKDSVDPLTVDIPSGSTKELALDRLEFDIYASFDGGAFLASPGWTIRTGQAAHWIIDSGKVVVPIPATAWNSVFPLTVMNQSASRTLDLLYIKPAGAPDNDYYAQALHLPPGSNATVDVPVGSYVTSVLMNDGTRAAYGPWRNAQGQLGNWRIQDPYLQ